MNRALQCFLVVLGFAFLSVACEEQSVLPAKQPSARAQFHFPISGVFDANVRTSIGVFQVPVEIETDRVKCIRWNPGNCLAVFDANLANGGQGVAANGDVVQIDLLDGIG
jgi:hypothetical protein